MKYCFAYGSNLWREQMLRRCPDHRFIGIGILRSYRWFISSRGYANIIKSPTDTVYGAVYEISVSDEQNLDIYEGVGIGSYRKEYILIDIENISIDCLVYIDPTTTEGLPKAEYIDKINQGITDADLPMEYVERYIRRYMPLNMPL